MRSIGLSAVAVGTLLLTSSCSDTGGPGNTAPVADFAVPECTINLPCSFASTSTDDAGVTKLSWDLDGDGHSDGDTGNASFIYETDGDFNVSLTVWDAQGLSNTKTSTITINPEPVEPPPPPPPVNQPPTADFTHSCAQAVCTFVSTSGDVAPGSIASSAWTFGDGGTAEGTSPSHTYSVTAPTEFTVTLTVTDNEGATAVTTKTIAVDPAPPANPPPVARFTYSCAGAVCTFVNTSFDHGGKVTASAWTFGDGGTSTETSPTHSYTVSTATEFTVTLTVTDDKGAIGVTSQKFTIDPAAANIPPTADFSTWCYGDGCIFTSASTDAPPGTILSYAWSFGDGATAEWNNWIFPKHLETHVYTVSARTKFTVTLTVTDNEGATAVATREVAVSPLPPAVQGCTTSGNNVECVLDIPARSTLKLKLLGVHCDLRHFDRSRITTPPPVGDQIWLSVCSLPVGRESGVFGGTMDELWVYQAGSQARIWFTQGEARPSEPLRGPPAGQLSGTFPDWTLSFDDGDNAGAPGEPNFTDLVVGVHATQR
jgi:PKD repeat protein